MYLTTSLKKGVTMASERSSIWEASTFYSRAQTAQTLYQTKSGKPFLPSTAGKYESEFTLPLIESDLNVLPKDNLCILDSSDPDLDYKLTNAAVHGLAVLLKNSERYPFSKLVQILIERDFLYDVTTNKEYLKIEDAELIINPMFRIVLHVNSPMSFCSSSRRPHPNNHLFHRLTTRSNASHFVIDLTPSREFIANDLLTFIMEHEKYGYTSQISLADKILFDAEFNIFNRQVNYYNCLIHFFPV